MQTIIPLSVVQDDASCRGNGGRVFVCGLVLDCCVIDTCLNALHKNLFDDVIMIVDATRPASIPGVGQFGSPTSGFLNDPAQVKSWIEEKQLPLVRTCALISSGAAGKLRHRGVPFLKEAGFTDQIDAQEATELQQLQATATGATSLRGSRSLIKRALTWEGRKGFPAALALSLLQARAVRLAIRVNIMPRQPTTQGGNKHHSAALPEGSDEEECFSIQLTTEGGKLVAAALSPEGEDVCTKDAVHLVRGYCRAMSPKSQSFVLHLPITMCT